MPEDSLKLVIGIIIFLLVILFFLRLKAYIRKLIANSIYDNFPAIKDKIEDFSKRIDYLNLKIEKLQQIIEKLRKGDGSRQG